MIEPRPRDDVPEVLLRPHPLAGGSSVRARLVWPILVLVIAGGMLLWSKRQEAGFSDQRIERQVTSWIDRLREDPAHMPPTAHPLVASRAAEMLRRAALSAPEEVQVRVDERLGAASRVAAVVRIRAGARDLGLLRLGVENGGRLVIQGVAEPEPTVRPDAGTVPVP